MGFKPNLWHPRSFDIEMKLKALLDALRIVPFANRLIRSETSEESVEKGGLLLVARHQRFGIGKRRVIGEKLGFERGDQTEIFFLVLCIVATALDKESAFCRAPNVSNSS